MRRTLALIMVATLARASTARADRLAPHATQQAALGCWDVGAGATLTLTAVGKHSVSAVARYTTRPRGGPAVVGEAARWSAAEQAYAVSCRPRSQHGSVCLVRPVTDGLAVRVVAFGAGGRVVGVVEELTARRCAAGPAAARP
jgi:hypothetical protein